MRRFEISMVANVIHLVNGIPDNAPTWERKVRASSTLMFSMLALERSLSIAEAKFIVIVVVGWFGGWSDKVLKN